MKKTTIALLTAAAMGTSGAVMAADHGPTVSGRVDMSIQNLDGEDVRFTDRSTVVGVGGSSELAGGLTGGYFIRASYTDTGGVDGANLTTDYAYFNISGDFGTVQFGRDDDIVYQFAGANTDVWRGLGPVGSAKYGDQTAVDAFRNAHLQYRASVDALSIGAYLDTAAEAEDGENGTNNYQLGVHYDFGMAGASVIFADSDDDAVDESELTIGATLDAGVASFAALYSDDTNGNNPYVVQASVPLTDILTANVGYGDDDAGTTDVAANIFANLGGGFDTSIGYRNGDSGDGVQINARYSF